MIIVNYMYSNVIWCNAANRTLHQIIDMHHLSPLDLICHYVKFKLV